MSATTKLSADAAHIPLGDFAVCESKFLGAGNKTAGVGFGGGGAAQTKAMQKAPPSSLLAPLRDPSLVPFDRLSEFPASLCATRSVALGAFTTASSLRPSEHHAP